MAGRRFNLRELRERCAIIERHVLHRRLATAEEAVVYRPGGSENPETGLGGWVIWYGQLVRFAGRAEMSEISDKADRDVLDALAAEPMDLQLTTMGPAGEPQFLTVHPKSAFALFHLRARDRVLGVLAQRISILELAIKQGLAGPDDAALLDRAFDELSYQYGVIAWIVTHPGAGLPFDPRTERKGDVPEQFHQLEPWDFIRLCQLNAMVNAQRLHALEVLIKPDNAGEESTKRPSWSVFFGQMADRLGIPTATLLRDVSLAEIIASARTGQPAHQRQDRPVDEVLAEA